MSKPDNREFATQSDKRGEREAAMHYLRENLPPDVFDGLHFDPRKLSMHDAELIVKRLTGKSPS